MASAVYNQAKLNLLRARFNFDTDTFYAMLVTSAYIPNFDTHDFRNDVTDEVVGTGYVAGGAAIAVTSMSLDAPTDTVIVDFADVSWPDSTITARAAVIYKRRGGAASADELFAYVDFGGDKTSVAGTFDFVLTAPLTLA